MSVQAPKALEGRRILIVDDEMLIAMELESLLRDEGCIVVGPASTCKKALRLIEADSLDACVLDLNLDGKPVTSVARELSKRNVPFVLVSGYSHVPLADPELQNARRLAKPVDEKELLSILGELVNPMNAVGNGGARPAGPQG